MCGILGIVAKSSDRYRDRVDAMIKVQNHRGPDSSATYSFENCLLGHNRLSIIDLHTGNQPMLNTDKTAGIVFNGEIYGYKEIKESLSYPFQTTSDTEVLLALYQKHGNEMINHVPGMFSFAIWDESSQSLFAARDRFGEKPFFYSVTKDSELVFASEIKTILASGLVEATISRSGLSRYLNYGYTGPLTTIYENIHVLPPAHYLVFKNGEVDVRRYWSYPTTTTDSISLCDAAERFEELFANAVQKQMIADVEVCAFLSGGLDSTSVVSAAKNFNPSLKTLAFGYKNQDNELHFAKAAAQLYKTEHHELLEASLNIDELLLKLPEIYDEPFSDSSALATYTICKLAAEKCKVVLTGDGGDELLGGYTWWYRPLVNELADRGSGKVKEAFVTAMAVAEKISEKASGDTSKRQWRNKFNSIKNSRGDYRVVDAVQRRFGYLDSTTIASLGLPMPTEFKSSWTEEGNINDAMKFDIADYMPGDILVKTDRASMANSLELRAPFLDVDFASYCISLPGSFKIDKSSDKILLREAMGKYWPQEIRNRGKQGFGVSKNVWQQYPKVKKLYDDYVHDKDSSLYKLLPFKETNDLISKNPNLVHAMLILAIWADKNYSI
ncbi:MAG: asparagine synthase (glutamine-hydrolyzing) [Chitinophagaceae bacterium]|nr:asparagine synthase (glutamine-hydrolyzing) [Chitinophagaceae bacterium]